MQRILCLGDKITIQSSPWVVFTAFRLPAPPLSIEFFSPDIQAAGLQRTFKVLSGEFTVVQHAWSNYILESSELKLNSDSNKAKEIILKRNFDVLVPKCIGRISFVFHFLEQIQSADWGAIVFGS